MKNYSKLIGRSKFSILKILLATALIVYIAILVILLLWGLFASLKTQTDFRKNVLFLPSGYPWEWAWSNFPYVLNNFTVEVTTQAGVARNIGMAEQILNTMLYAGVGAFLATLIPCITAYLCAKFNYKLSKIIYFVVIVTMVLPIVGAYPSEIRLLRNLHLYDTILGSWLQKANFLGIYFLVFFATFKGIEPAFSEAAYIDGASEFRVMSSIIFPLVRNVFFTIFLIKFIEFWNDYQTPLLYLPSHPTLAYGIFDLSNSRINGLSTVPMRLTGCIIMVLPILTLFLIFKNKLIGNLSMGGVKG